MLVSVPPSPCPHLRLRRRQALLPLLQLPPSLCQAAARPLQACRPLRQVCLLLRQLALSVGWGAVETVLAEGLLIAGWVALWRPLEIFLYEWWPIRAQARLFERLSEMEVRVLGAPPAMAAVGAAP